MVRVDLANEVGDLLGLPRMGRTGKAYEIVGAIVRTITDGLLRGEKVKIDGFGIFEIYERAPYRHSACFYKTFSKGAQQVVEFPAKKRVIFKPSRPLVRSLNL